jgi:hypothetical protein
LCIAAPLMTFVTHRAVLNDTHRAVLHDDCAS